MYARMTIMMIQPDRIDEAVAIYKKSVVPAAKKQKGFRGVCLLKDVQTGKGISVTFWKSERDAMANEESLYYQEQLAKFLEIFSGPPIKEGYDVVVHLLQSEPGPRSPKKK
jgi:heme-degrading monooxygenase HmoA